MIEEKIEKTLTEKLNIASKKLENSIKLMESHEVKSDLLSRFIASYTFITMQHTESIIILLKNNKYISTSSLARPLFEALIRGTWLCHKGTEDIANKINEDSYTFETMNIMCEDIDLSIGQRHYEIIKDKIWKALNSYTHGGTHLLSRCVTENCISPNFTDKELGEFLSSSLTSMLMMIYEYADYANNEDLRDKIGKMIAD